VRPRTSRLVRITLRGPELRGLERGLPAASVRLLLPPEGQDDVVMPSWNGNEFLFDDGSRPAIRTLTPLRVDESIGELEVEVVLHGDGPLSRWARSARPGQRAAVAGTGRGYQIDPSARSFLLAGDESAVPAVTVLLEALPVEASVDVHLELEDVDEAPPLPHHPGASVHLHPRVRAGRSGDALVDAVASSEVDSDTLVWVAGEAAAVQRIRRHLFEERGVARSRAVVRGYWKHGRGGD
jgi:NADPH-dependent ferric siderophore reductase